MVPNIKLANGNEYSTRPRRCCRKARQANHGGYKTILERWHNDDQYRKSLSDIVWTEEQIIQYGELALEDTPVLQRERKELETGKIGTLVEKRRCSRTTESTS